MKRENDARFVQVNVNRSWAAMDLLRQRLTESGAALGLVSEPPHGYSAGNLWFPSGDGLAAVLWRPESSGAASCRLVVSRENFVIVRFDSIYIGSVYISPNIRVSRFEEVIEDLSGAMSSLNGPFLICGDFNSRSVSWGSPSTDRRGELLERWAATFDLSLANGVGVYTCVRPQGSSVVDLTWFGPRRSVEIAE